MSVANLHTLINKPWYIHHEYSRALLPSLFSILTGNTVIEKDIDPNTIQAFSALGSEIDISANQGSTSSNEKHVIVLGLKSPVFKYDQDCGPSGTKTLIKRMEAYRNDPNVAGIVLDIDSGGGQVSGTQEAHDYIKAFPLPVVTYTDGMLCSAAYYLGSGANYIIGNPRLDYVGSIGTMIEFIDVTGYYKKLGAKVISKYATKSTAKNIEYRELIENDNDQPYIKNILDPITETFHKDMKAARPGLSEKVLDGSTYKAKKALKLNLINELGTLNTAINKVFELSNNKSQKTKTMSKSTNRPLLQAALAIDTPLQEVDGHAQITTAMLDSMEAHLATQATAITTAGATTTQAQADQATAEGATATLEASLNTLIESNEIEVGQEPTNEERISAIQAHITELGSRDAATATTVAADAAKKEEENTFIDASATHNVLADQLNK